MASTSDIQSLRARTKNPMQWRIAFRALRALVKNNDDTTQVFKIVDALRGNSDIRNTERMKQSEIGRKILSERRSLIDVLSAREQLRGLPEGTLGRVYLDFMESEGLSADGLAAAAEEGYQYGRSEPDIATYSAWARDSHDLWHVLTGYGRDPLGELGLLGVLYSQAGNLGTAFIALLALPKIAKAYPGAPTIRTVLQGFRTGRRAEWLMDQDWEVLLTRPIDEVRSELRIGPASYYELSLPMFEASRSNSGAAMAMA